MYKNRILVLFLVSISILSYSCVAKKITRPTPKETDKKLSITIDYYGGSITTAPDDAVTVEIYKTKDSANDVNIRAFKKYTLKDFIDSTKPVIIPLNYEVVIKLSKRDVGDSTDISGDVPNDGTFQSDTEELQFTIKDHKSFIITFSQVKIEKVAVNFKALENGYIDVVVKKDDKTTNLNYKVDADSEREIEFIKSWFSDYTIEATAIGDKDYDFKGWSDDASGNDNPLEILESMDGKTITANFLETPITITFEAGANGSVYVDFTNIDDSVVTNKLVAIASGTGSITISKSLLETQKIEARAVADTDYKFNEWSGGATGEDNPLEIVDTMDGQTITASFVKDKFTFTFTAGANGAIEIYRKEKTTGSIDELIKTISAVDNVVTINGSEFDTYTFKAKAVADTDYKFNEWSGGATGNDNPLEILDTMDGQTITASFVKMITFTFTAGAAGAIDVYVFDGSTGLSNKRVSANNIAGTIELAEYLFTAPYRVEARAEGYAGYGIDNWNVDTLDTAPIKQLDTAKTTHTATFKVVTINYGTASSSLSSQTIGVDTWYQIKTPADLLFVANEIEKGSSPYASYKYIIMNHIDYGGGYHKPIGGYTTGKRFTGVINGNGKTIKNAKYGKTTDDATFTYTGFVGYMDGGTISNLTIDSSVVINSTALNTGGIAGYARAGATISDCVNKANISSYSIQSGYYVSTGGIVGSITGSGATVLNVYNTGNIEGYGPTVSTGGVSGLIGNGGKVENAYNTGKIEVSSTTTVYIGGVSGSTDYAGKIVNAYNTGEIVYSKNANPLFLGGVVGVCFNSTGANTATVDNVYSTGTISSSASATHYIGGIAGHPGTATTLANMYFVNANALPTHGFYSDYTGTYTADKTVGVANSWADVFTAFNASASGSGVWEQKTAGARPVIKGLGEGK